MDSECTNDINLRTNASKITDKILGFSHIDSLLTLHMNTTAANFTFPLECVCFCVLHFLSTACVISTKHYCFYNSYEETIRFHH